ncbi:tetratricopeptide repeat protein [Thermophagus sp. OGC60D27]|uniref:tetratricopeptide repeat protein n=1 Tax=Thermophagus sp. OGC60D27 TaxID=3458415 RepID=UPI00403788CC
MKIRKLIATLLLPAILAGCNPLKQLQTNQASLKSAFEQGHYSEVLVHFENIKNYHTTHGTTVETDYLKIAAQSAVELQRYPLAEELLTEWIDRSDDLEAVEMLGKVYEDNRQIEKEYQLWTKYWDKIDSQELKNKIGQKLFSIEMERKEYEKALERSRNMPPLSDPRMLFLQVKALDATGKTDDARTTCNSLLEKYPDFKPALEWKGKDIYQSAEKWYKAEMSKYNKDPNYTAYVYLKRELKKISSLYRQSREIFKSLHQDDPEKQSYIKYLKNIYLRLDMKKEAAKMDMLLKKQR